MRVFAHVCDHVYAFPLPCEYVHVLVTALRSRSLSTLFPQSVPTAIRARPSNMVTAGTTAMHTWVTSALVGANTLSSPTPAASHVAFESGLHVQ